MAPVLELIDNPEGVAENVPPVVKAPVVIDCEFGFVLQYVGVGKVIVPEGVPPTILKGLTLKQPELLS